MVLRLSGFKDKEVVVSHWTGKFVIGLTGNIGTGKSVVRQMLEGMGAFGVDADDVAHQVIRRGEAGYAPVLAAFGSSILGANKEIERAKLAGVVFKDPQALIRLEDIIHPLVDLKIESLIQSAASPVVVIEAIKLIESGISLKCDCVWVTVAHPDIQLKRLVEIRHLSEADARRRIAVQPPQEAKASLANLVINNNAALMETRQFVLTAWEKTVPIKPGKSQTKEI